MSSIMLQCSMVHSVSAGSQQGSVRLQLAERRAHSAIPQRRCCMCQATSADTVQSHRRAFLAGSLTTILFPAAANALIPDDDDEDLIKSARANRTQRIKEEKTTEQDFSRLEGLNKNDLASVQRAINRLAKSGSDLDSGKVADVASSLGEKWVGQFEKAAENIAGQDGKKSASEVLQAVSSLGSSAKGGDLKQTKQKYVAAVSALQSWVASSGIQVKGL